MRPSESGVWGWLGVGTVVVIFDGWQVLLKRETMSSALDRWLYRPIVAGIIAGGWLGLTGHLFGRWVKRLLVSWRS